MCHERFLIVPQNFKTVVGNLGDHFCFQAATDHWLDKGVDGVLLYGFEHVAKVVPLVWDSIRETVSNHTEEDKKK